MKLILLLPFMLFSFVFLVLDANVVLAQENTAEDALPPAAILQDTTQPITTRPLISISTPVSKPRAPYNTEAGWFSPGCTECWAMQKGPATLGDSRFIFRRTDSNKSGKGSATQRTGQ